MAKFRKKPVVVEAVQLPVAVAPSWLADAMDAGTITLYSAGDAFVQTLEGQMHALQGDWLIRGVKGEIYPCKPDIFAATYEPVADHADVQVVGADR